MGIVIKFKDHNQVISPYGLTITRLFHSVDPQKIMELSARAEATDPGYRAPDFLCYYTIECPPGTSSTQLLQQLRGAREIALAYIDKGLVNAPFVNGDGPLTTSQGYLDPAPTGIDARFAWTIKGGNGESDVQLIDIEQGWITEHEDLQVQTLPLTGISHAASQDHGTATLGVIAMQDNDIGGTGITPRVKPCVISRWRPDGSFNTADAIMAACTYLQYGDVLLLEAQCYDASTQTMLWPVEIQEACFQAIRLATALGIIVIEAAGNGCEGKAGNNLDRYTDPQGNNVLNLNHRDSGAIMVAAAGSTVPHRRIIYSNYGSRIDCYAWGEHVHTAGNYPNTSGAVINLYTKAFNGTSSAAAIIAGAALSVQSIAAANGLQRFGPKQMRSLLSHEPYGTPSENGHATDRIGSMPDLRKIIPLIR